MYALKNLYYRREVSMCNIIFDIYLFYLTDFQMAMFS